MRRPAVRLAVLLAMLLCWRAVATAATLTVSVQGVRSDRGHIRIGVCQKSAFLSERCAYHAIVPARPGEVSATISNIAPGVYAVAAYQDEDDSGKLKRTIFSMPKEDLGFSRNPPMRFGPPTFADCAIAIRARHSSVVLKLRKFGR